MLRAAPEVLKRRATDLAERIRKRAPGLEVTLHDDTSQVGSGSLPGESLPTTLVGLTRSGKSASSIARRLRLGEPPVYTRIVDDRVCLDPRTIQPDETEMLVDALKEIS